MNMIEKRKQMRGQGGFTLIELLVVIAILAVLAGAAIIGIGAMRGNAQETACKSDMDTVSTAAEAWVIDTNAAAIPTVQDLLDDDYIKKGVENADFTIGGTVDAMTVSANGGNKYSAATATACNTP